MSSQQDPKKTVMNGVVVSCPSEHTVIVEVTSYKTHPKYRKKYRFSKRYHVHDEKGGTKVGEKVEFISSRPVSKRKTFSLSKRS